MSVRSVTEDDLRTAALDELDVAKVCAHVATYAQSSLGADRLRSLQQFTDANALRQELQRTQEVVDVMAAGDEIPFDRLADVSALLRKTRIAGAFLSAPEMLNVLEAMQTSRAIRRFFAERAERTPALAAFVRDLVDDRVLEKHITDAIDDTGTVRDNASRELQSIRREIHELSARLRTRLQRILKKFGDEELLTDEFITQRDGRFVLPLRVENKRSVEGIIHGVSQTGSTVFMEPAETYEMNNELSLLANAELREIARILTVLTAEVGSVSHSIEEAVDVLTSLDMCMAKARHAMKYGGICPTISDDEEIELTRVYHPLLKQQAVTSKIDVIPLSVSFDATTRGILISGPNAGGKTVAMKTIGCSIAMALSGLFPLGMVTTGMCRLFSAIGDHQSIDSNLSTFSSQIIRLRDILSYCGSDALVMIDEICAGTDPAEGGALAAGILDSLVERKTFFVVTTHQSSLKQYALTRPSIRNASLAFDDVQLQPTFQFLSGVPGNSYAFVLAQNVGLPEVVISRARTYLGDRHDELEQSIAAMQRFRTEAEAHNAMAREQAAKAERIKADYEERLTQFKKKRSELVESAREEAREILRKAQALIENSVREVREQQRAAQDVKKDFERERDVLTKSEIEPTPAKGTPKGSIVIGSSVVLRGTSTAGTVMEIDAKGASALVEVNGIKFRFPLAQLDLSAQKPVVKRDDSVIMKFDAHTSLDLRGMRADEGLNALESFLNDGILAGLSSGTIIHGKGTGALRKVVQEYLHEHPQITSFRLGTIQEGGDGVTIVEFR